MRMPLDREGSEPLYRQIQAFLAEQIRSGRLEPETRLPATRELSSKLGVSRITVTNAYAELEAEGLVIARAGSGTYVAELWDQPPDAHGGQEPSGDWPLWQQELLSQTWLPTQRELEGLADKHNHPDLISFAEGQGAEDIFPTDDFRKSLQHVLRRDGRTAFGYGDAAGYPPLRFTIAQILTNQGIPTSSEEILVTSGSQQAIALVARLLTRPGDVVLVESPTYPGAIDLFRSMAIRLLGIPVDEHGMMVEQVEQALRTARPRLIYTIPTFQNPTGTCMAGLRRRQLMALADRYNVPILEDDCFGDLRYEGRTRPALKALDPGGRVIYINTFSKMLMPGLRVGYLSASGPVYERLKACKRAYDLATSQPMQRALEAYISVGRYNTHLRRACRIYSRRLEAMVEALQRELPSEVEWRTPEGGLYLWVQLPEGDSSLELYPFAMAEGVTYAPGSSFFPGERAQPYMRLNFAIHPRGRMETGIHRLAHAIERYWAEGGARKRSKRGERRVSV